MFFTAMKNILSKGNVVHIQNEEEIDVMLHQNAFVIIDTLMNNVFHSNFLTQIERLKPVHVIIFSPFNIKRCLGKVPVTFVPRKTFYCHKHNIMMILNLKRINELVRHQHINYLV